MSTHVYPYPRPALAVDVVVVGIAPSGLQVLLIERGRGAFAGTWALPGGHVDEDEPIGAAARRELAEETGLIGIDLVEVGSFGDPGRDPNGWVVSIAHLGVALPNRVTGSGADDARRAAWFSVDDLPVLAFDHARIIMTALGRLGERRPAALPEGQSPARRPTLMLAAGVTASGKSTFCRLLTAAVPDVIHLDVDLIRRNLLAGHPHYGPREAWHVHDAVKSLAEWCLAMGQDVVVDATGLTPADRAHYLASAELFGARDILVWCQADEATARLHLAHRAAGEDPLDASSAGISVRTRLSRRVQMPVASEASEMHVVEPSRAVAVIADLVAGLN